MVAVAQTRGIAPSLLVSPTEAVRTGPPPRHRRIVVSPSAAGLDTVVVPYNGRGLCNSLHGGGRTMRRLASLALPFALACLAVAAAPAANAQEPTIVTDITFPEEGEPFGTFTATAPLCPSGTFVDQSVSGGGAFRSEHVFYHA